MIVVLPLKFMPLGWTMVILISETLLYISTPHPPVHTSDIHLPRQNYDAAITANSTRTCTKLAPPARYAAHTNENLFDLSTRPVELAFLSPFPCPPPEPPASLALSDLSTHSLSPSFSFFPSSSSCSSPCLPGGINNNK